MKWPNNSGAATRSVPMICSLLVGGLALGWTSWAQAETQAPFGGAIEAMTIDTPGDVFSGGTITVAGQLLILPRNLLIDQPANRLTLQQMFAQAPAGCLNPDGTIASPPQSGLAAADTCVIAGAEGAVVGAVGPILANRQTDGTVIVGELWILKGSPEEASGVVTEVNTTEGYIRINGLDADPGLMIRFNDPEGVHSIQGGAGCPVGPAPLASNCSPDTRFGLDPDNYTITFTTGYPVCIPSTVTRGAAPNDSDGTLPDALCPDSNRGDNLTRNSIYFAPVQVGDHIAADGNMEDIGGVRFLSAHTLTVAVGLTTRDDPGQPDYMIFDEVEWDVPGFQNERTRVLLIGFTTLGNSGVEIWKLGVDPATGENVEYIFGSSFGCDAANGAVEGEVGLCTQQGIPPNSAGIFKIRYDVDFLEASLNPIGEPVKPKLSPCSHLNAAGGLFLSGGATADFTAGQEVSPDFVSSTTGCGPDGSVTIEQEFAMVSPATRELIGRTLHKSTLTAGVFTYDINGNEATNGEYLTPVGIGHPEFGEINLDATATPFIFEGTTWNLDRRTGPNGCDGVCETLAEAPIGTLQLDPFPCSGLDPRFQALTPSNYDRVLAFHPYGDTDLLPLGPFCASYAETVPPADGGGTDTGGGGGEPTAFTIDRARFNRGPSEWRIDGISELPGDTLVIYHNDPVSENILVTVVADEFGNWEYREKFSGDTVIDGDWVTVVSATTFTATANIDVR